MKVNTCIKTKLSSQRLRLQDTKRIHSNTWVNGTAVTGEGMHKSQRRCCVSNSFRCISVYDIHSLPFSLLSLVNSQTYYLLLVLLVLLSVISMAWARRLHTDILISFFLFFFCCASLLQAEFRSVIAVQRTTWGVFRHQIVCYSNYNKSVSRVKAYYKLVYYYY